MSHIPLTATGVPAYFSRIGSTDAGANLSGYLTNDAGFAATRNGIVMRNINTGDNTLRKGLNVYLEHDIATSSNYDGLQVNVGATVDAFTVKAQGQTDGAEILHYGAMMNASFTSVANASAGSTVYTGTIENGANNGAVGLSFVVVGFTNGANNGTFQATASTATTLTLNNAAGVAETHAATATVASNFTLTSVATSVGSTAVYTGTIPGGAANYYAGWQFRVYGFVATPANNGLFTCSASTATSLTLSNAAAVAETHAATAVWYTIGEINVLKLRWGASQQANVLNNSGILQYLPSIQAGSSVENFAGFSIDAPSGGGSIWNFTGVNAGTNLNSMANVNVEIGLNASASSNPSVTGIAIVATGKTAGILVNDSPVAGSFIGHGNSTTLALHDGWYGSTGSPEGVVTANGGSIYSRQNSTIGDVFYVKGTASGNTGWSPSSSIGPITTKTTTYSATNSDDMILGNGTFTVTLPNTGVPVGKDFTVKNIGTGVITVSSVANIDGSTTATLNTQYQSITVRWDGTQYWIK